MGYNTIDTVMRQYDILYHVRGGAAGMSPLGAVYARRYGV